MAELTSSSPAHAPSSPPIEPFAISQTTPGLVPIKEQSVSTHSLKPSYQDNEPGYPVPPIQPLPDYPPPQLEPPADPLVADPDLMISVDDPEAEVEVDPEVWIAVAARTPYYTLQVPSSNGNALIASSAHVDDIWIDVPGSNDHRWPVLTSKRHTVKYIPQEFQQWMGPIQLFLDKSAEYLHPYENCVKRRRIVSAWFLGIGVMLIVLAITIATKFYNNIFLVILVAAVPFILVAAVLNLFVKRGLVNGVKALKLCGKYEKSVLPPSIKVILGPYGVYWKFVLRN